MANLMSHSQRYIAQYVSYKYCLKVAKFHCDSCSGFGTVEEVAQCAPSLKRIHWVVAEFSLWQGSGRYVFFQIFLNKDQ